MNSGKHLKLNILDQSPIRPGSNSREAILETVQLAKLADELGYHRYWVSEHHNTGSLAGSTPEVLIAHLAGQTSNLRIGSGGIMLPNHSALKVAENFRMLETLFPNRIDLGMGRAPGTDRLTASVLNPSNTFSEQAFIEQLADLQQYLTDTADNRIKATPVTDTVPQLWLLSSSGQSGLFAAHFGMGFSFAHFINPTGGPEAAEQYRARFNPSEQLNTPLVSVAAFVFCADTEEKAQQLQAVMLHYLLDLEKGVRLGFKSYEELQEHQYTYPEQERLAYHRRRTIAGTPEQIRLKIDEMAGQYNADEFTAVTITTDFADRLRSYELLAGVFELAAAEH